MSDYGVIIGRFQIDDLTQGHRRLIHHAITKHTVDKVIILVGTREAVAGSKNPLSFLTRKEMIQESWPNILILPLLDQPTDEMWVKKVDETIKSVIGFSASATIYHGRDSIGKHYNGRYPLELFTSGIDETSASQRREIIKKSSPNTQEKRWGVIHAYENLHFRTHETVDIALFNYDTSALLVVQKPEDSNFWRLPGGFIDKGEVSRQAAAREVHEETGMTIVNGEKGLHIFDDFMINDWRIRDEPNVQHRTILLYGMAETLQPPVAGDDIARVKWIEFPTNPWNWEQTIKLWCESNIMPSHREITTAAINSYLNYKENK